VTACSGRCGREGAGPADSGNPGLDERFTWCGLCWAGLLAGQLPPGLEDAPSVYWVNGYMTALRAEREAGASRG
jgi:hypothetical protein